MEDEDAGCLLRSQLQSLHGVLAVLVDAEHVVLDPGPVDVVLKQVDAKGLGNAWKTKERVGKRLEHQRKGWEMPGRPNKWLGNAWNTIMADDA